MLCPVCNSEMDIIENKKNPKGPDFRCPDANCMFELDRTTGEYVPSKFRTATWLPKKDGFKREIRASALPSKVPQQNGDREELMKLSYKKDLLIALIDKFGENYLAHDIVAMHREYWSELTNPMGKL